MKTCRLQYYSYYSLRSYHRFEYFVLENQCSRANKWPSCVNDKLLLSAVVRGVYTLIHHYYCNISDK